MPNAMTRGSARRTTNKVPKLSVTAALQRLRALESRWQEVQPVEDLKETAKRLLRVHNLRAADSLQLAAAIVASEHRPSSVDFVCLDERLTATAQREGFNVVMPAR